MVVVKLSQNRHKESFRKCAKRNFSVYKFSKEVTEINLRKSVRNSFFAAISLLRKKINFNKSATNGNFMDISQ